MRNLVILTSLLVLISACGDKAPKDAVVTGPTDGTFAAAQGSTASSVVRFRPLDFFVTNEAGDPIPDVEIEFFSTGSAFLTDIDGNLLSNSDRTMSKTDDAGLGRISIIATIPGCVGTTAVALSAGVLATVGSASDNFTATLTRTCS